MSLHVPSRRIFATAPTILQTLRPTVAAPTTLTYLPVQTRPASSRKPRLSERDPNILEGLKNAGTRKLLEDEMRSRMTATVLESKSIFDEDFQHIRHRRRDRGGAAAAAADAALPTNTPSSVMGASLQAAHARHAVDPDPKSRRRWERKMVLRRVARALDVRGRETRAERLRRTEREVLSRSPWLATSTKKLVHLARQVSGKTLEDARTQMRFSRKKFAREVLYELDLARDRAVVERGMGLGRLNGEFVPGLAEPTRIRDVRHSKWVEIDDPTRMYVHEAWVNKGPWRGQRPNYRARGAMNIIQMPQASITIRLKEEKSRLREAEERKAKEFKKGPWIHLPNRPVTAQRPFYSW